MEDRRDGRGYAHIALETLQHAANRLDDRQLRFGYAAKENGLDLLA
jgi:hypothetical protein